MESSWLTLGILLAGIVAVVGGVLALRLHAFLALILGALLVGVLTPTASVERYETERRAVSLVDLDEFGASDLPDAFRRLKQNCVFLDVDASRGARLGSRYLLLRWETDVGQYREVGDLEIVDFSNVSRQDGQQIPLAVARIVDSDGSVSIQAKDIVVSPLRRREAFVASREALGQRVANGFGSTCAKIGILIAMAAIIGKCLLDSGAADRIVRSMLNRTGERGAPAAFLTSGFLLGIPVFFDTVFYLMIPLGKAMRVRTGRNYLLYVLTIVAGATMAHSLVPPTPGPLFVAEQLGVDLGVMILGGAIVGLFTAGVGCAWAYMANTIWKLPLRESSDLTLETLEEISQREESDLPPTWLSLLPILLPVLLIGGYAVLKRLVGDSTSEWMSIAATLGDKNIALIISAAIALITLVRQKRTRLEELAESAQAALASGGVIILITAAGGAFGHVLQQTNVSGLIRQLPETSPALIICFAWLITMAIRTSQGSATVAMITAVGILSGLAADLPFHPVYLALAIGCGSKPISWMNDSGFWVITKMSGMTEAEGLKFVTPMTALMGIAGLVVTLVGVTLFP